MNKLTNRFVRICLFLMLFTAISSLILNTTSAYSANGVASSKNTGTAAQAIPAHVRNITQNMFSMGPDGSSEVNVNAIYSHEPAPMGIADFGIGQNGAYQYNTNSFEGIVSINSLSTSANDPNDPTPKDPLMGIQLNVNLQFTMNNQQYVYWIQDCAQLDTSSNKIRFLDNIWNSTQASVNMDPSGVSGNGQVTAYNGGQTYYYDWANSGNQINLQYPATITLSVTCGPSSGGPTVSFAYNYGNGLVTYDTVKLLTSYPITSFSGFIVDGYDYTPCGNFYDSELILGGPYGGIKTQLLESDVQLQLEYWNGNNYQTITNAYNFGSDTAEGISNTLSQGYYYPSTGEIFAEIQSGSGSLGELYYQSIVGIIDVRSSIVSGTLYVTNANSENAVPWQTAFINGEVTITIFPGDYNLQLYQNGVLYDQVNCTVSAGQTISTPQMTSITLLPAVGSTPLNATNYFEVSYTLWGEPQLAYAQNSTLTFSADAGTNVVISGVSTGSISTGSLEYGNLTIEEWVFNSQGGSVNITAGSTTTLYYYDLLNQQVGYIASENSISPILTYYTAPSTSSSQSNSTVTAMALSFWWQQIIMVQRGTTVSVSNNILGTSQDQWATPTSSWNISQANQIYADIPYYHQYQVTASFATSDGSVPSSAPLLSGTQFGSSYQLPLTTTGQVIWLDENTPWSVSTVVTASSLTEQWVISTGSSGTITQAVNINPTYLHQYYLGVASPYGSSSGSGWYNSGSTAYAGLNSGTISGGTGIQYVFTSWSGGASGSNYAQSNAIIMDTPITAIANWSTQYYLTVSSLNGSPTGQGWYNSGSTAYAGLNAGIVSGGTSTQYVFSFWSTGGTNYVQSSGITMNAPITTTASWITQYQMTFAVIGGGSTSPTGSNVWENAGSLSITATPNAGYTFSNWSSNTTSITFSNANSAATSATINGPGTITVSFLSSTPTSTPGSTSTPTPTPMPAATPIPTTVPPSPTPTLTPTSTPFLILRPETLSASLIELISVMVGAIAIVVISVAAYMIYKKKH